MKWSIINYYNGDEINKKIKLDIRLLIIKFIAFGCMVIDHSIKLNLIYDYGIFNILSRCSIILYSYLIYQGINLTSDINKYQRNILIFAIISIIPHFLFSIFASISIKLNILFGFLLSIILIKHYFNFKNNDKNKYNIYICISILLLLLFVDYGWYITLLLFTLYFLKNKKDNIEYLNFKKQIHFLALFLFFTITMTYIGFVPDNQILGFFAIIFLFYFHYDKKIEINYRTYQKIKYSFYFLYPLHFIILLIIYIL